MYDHTEAKPRHGWVVVGVILAVVLGLGVSGSVWVRSSGSGGTDPSALDDTENGPVQLTLGLVQGRDSYAVGQMSETVVVRCEITNRGSETIHTHDVHPGEPFDPLKSGLFLDVDFRPPGGEWTRVRKLVRSGPQCVVVPAPRLFPRVEPGCSLSTRLGLRQHYDLNSEGLVRVQARLQCTGVENPDVWVGEARSATIEFELRGSPFEIVGRVLQPLRRNETRRMSELVALELRNRTRLALEAGTLANNTTLEIRGPLRRLKVLDEKVVEQKRTLGPDERLSLLGPGPLWDCRLRRDGDAPVAVRLQHGSLGVSSVWIEIPLAASPPAHAEQPR